VRFPRATPLVILRRRGSAAKALHHLRDTSRRWCGTGWVTERGPGGLGILGSVVGAVLALGVTGDLVMRVGAVVKQLAKAEAAGHRSTAVSDASHFPISS